MNIYEPAPIVSVLTTAFNREKYIKAAIESVLASSFADFELIIVDDGSTDNTLQIARAFERTDSRVKVYVNEKNLGDYPNRNKAASYARGKYLKYVDADDLIYPSGLEVLVSSMEQFPEAGWGLCSLRQDSNRMFPFSLSAAEAYRYHYLGPGLFHKAPLSSIIKRDLFEKVGGFNPIRMAGDFEMWHRLAMHSPVVLMQEGIVWSREHAEREMKDHNQFKTLYQEISRKYLENSGGVLDASDLQAIARRKQKDILRNSVKNVLRKLWPA